MPEVVLTRQARELLGRLPQALQQAVLNAITRLRADPWAAGKPLRGRFRGQWVMRVGRYRVLYTIEGPEERAVVVVRAVRHRGVAYRRRRGV